MIALALAGFLFAVCVLTHLLICRYSPQKSLKAKLFIFLSVAGLAALAATCVLARLPLVLTACILYALMVPAYLVFYCSTELMSPSKKILQTIGSGGADYPRIFKALEQENFIMARLEELEQSGCLRRIGERYVLAGPGTAIARLLDAYQKLLGRGVGG